MIKKFALLLNFETNRALVGDATVINDAIEDQTDKMKN